MGAASHDGPEPLPGVAGPICPRQPSLRTDPRASLLVSFSAGFAGTAEIPFAAFSERFLDSSMAAAAAAHGNHTPRDSVQRPELPSDGQSQLVAPDASLRAHRVASAHRAV